MPVLYKLVNHLWYLSEKLVALSLHDSGVSLLQKRNNVKAMDQREAQCDPLKRCNIHLENIQEKELNITLQLRTHVGTLKLLLLTSPSYRKIQSSGESWTAIISLDSYNNNKQLFKV